MSQDDMTEMHWLIDMIQTVDVGVVVLDRENRIQVWNGFMESHSGKLPSEVRGKTLFEVFDYIDEEWFNRKTRPVFELRTRAFMTWEQRPFLFKFPNYRPITGSEDVMYQNITLSALTSTTGQVDNICMMIYDVTDIAANKKELEAVQVRLLEDREKSTSN
ncbi:PAS domain-containing protein [Aestuariibacter sp. AA17]|uniref:PAS domain-containing protein n=1 Tax=Fluctibacter corallii TaxID=2984329 RepID=A0ABT3A7Z2_9ALTE|nr:PAS domain-containing protein [Aestuariibacter sp. AA17]MCV2884804.1 PAS domain-containing protein [Aestuariibacter sp. AA17]